ncbi:MAG: AMP-binding protein [Bacteroidales bacterium]|nr:AMP-binding protein [Bacteroidales bacterium]MBQ7213215.1 AMP-binding protein [Bacteroidales bacterium]
MFPTLSHTSPPGVPCVPLHADRSSLEFQPADVIRHYQEERVQEVLSYLAERSPFYRDLFRREHLDVKKLKKLEDLRYIPTTDKRDLQEHNNDFLCVPRAKVADYITTSGTLGNPVTFAATVHDLHRLAYNEQISFQCAGIGPGDVIQLMTTMDKRFMAGMAYFLGAVRMGAGMIRVGNGIPALQWDTINRIRPDVIMVVPSFILRIIQYAEEQGIDYQNTSIRKAVCIGENLREQDFSLNLLGRRIKEKWDIELYSTYASTEMGTSFCECKAGQGGHHHPELIYCELLDEEGNPVPEGEAGELTVTTIGVEAMPLLRFRTGDMARFHTEPCSCGRNTMRISPLIGRKSHMIKYKGTTLYPPAIFDILDNTPYVDVYCVDVADNEIGTDSVTVHVGLRPSCMLPHETIVKELKDLFRARLRVAPEISIDDTELLRRTVFREHDRKPVKFFDFRKKNIQTT